MKLILLTSPEFFVEEDKILASLFEEGLDILHLRKPGSEPVYCERLLSLLPAEYLGRVVVHDHFYLRDEFGLMGVHLSRRHSEPPAGYRGPVTRTCYSLAELREHKRECEYVCLRNVFDSISDPQGKASFTPDELLAAKRDGLVDRKVMAEGGVTLDNVGRVRDMGFGGAAVMGDIWSRFDIHSHCDFKELITHFRRLRKALA